MAAETDARCQGDVKKPALFFEKLGASSPLDTRKSSEIINRKGCGGTAGSGAPMQAILLSSSWGRMTLEDRWLREVLLWTNDNVCPAMSVLSRTPPYSYCPYTPCDICDKVHNSPRCPYFDHLPQGATFPRGYEIVCRCGNLFNEDKWACSSCGGGIPVLKAKYCSICNVYYQHSVYECPVDKEHAAKYKSARDEMLSRVPIPLCPVYPESS
ncbi:hypothetical protein ACLB2K_021086 [Fragaria x ananassa]